jgi:hypothetical protein
MGQMTRGLAAEGNPISKPSEDEDSRLDVSAVDKRLERLKWHLWHGNVFRALQLIADLEWDLEAPEEPSERSKKLRKAVREFHHYIEANRSSIPNYGDRYRHGETIATSFAESTVNQVISRRMVRHVTQRRIPYTIRRFLGRRNLGQPAYRTPKGDKGPQHAGEAEADEIS